MSSDAMTSDAIAQRVKTLLVEELHLDLDPADIALDDVLHAPHIRLDSLGYLRLLQGLERAFDLRLDLATLGATVFETVGDVAAFVAARRGAPGAEEEAP